MSKRTTRILFLLIFTLFFFVGTVSARVGVGVTTGKIYVDETLRPGEIYELPSLTVVNTGDEAAEYQVKSAYRETQEELAPPSEWFSFTPEKFELEPGETQTIQIKLSLPLRVEPGDYFAFLEGSPTKVVDSGGAAIGVAAAAKLYFTVEPANIFSAMYYKARTFWNVYAPWPQRVTIAFVVIAALVAIQKNFNIQISTKGKKKVTNEDESGDE